MPELERKVLTGHTSRLTTSNAGGCGVFFSIIFIALGIGIIGIIKGFIPRPTNSIHAPDNVILAVGGMFLLSGFLMLVGGLRGISRRRRRAQLMRARAHEPWAADYDWDRRGFQDETVSKIFSTFFGVLGFSLFMAPFNWWAFWSDNSHIVVVIVTSIFDLIILGMIWYAIYLTLRFMKYGRSSIRFERFPYHVGEPLTVQFKSSSPIRSHQLTFTLRCIEETLEMVKTQKGHQSKTVCTQVYGDAQTVELDGQFRFRGVDLPVTFNIPQRNYETHLAGFPGRYWELEVSAVTDGVDFGATFLVPVYGGAG